jgi:hypothetical protein
VNERDWEFLRTLERRRNQSDSIAWTVPSLAIAAEAFLLTIVLRPETAPGSRLVAAAVGALVIFAALRLLWKSVFNFDLWDAHINDQRRRLHLRPVRTRDDLLPAAQNFPVGEKVRDRRYSTGLRKLMIVDLAASTVWIWTLRILLGLNLLLAVLAFVEWAGWSDVGLFGGDEGERDSPSRGKWKPFGRDDD